MKLSGINYAAVRAFNRLWGKRAVILDIGAQMDRQFDGGEWSDYYNDRIWEREMQQCAWRIARRFNLGANELLTQIARAGELEFDFMRLGAEEMKARRRNAA